MNKNMLITGGTGFIGSVLCKELLALGYKLTVLSRRPTAEVRALCGPVETIDSLEHLRAPWNTRLPFQNRYSGRARWGLFETHDVAIQTGTGWAYRKRATIHALGSP